MSAPEHPFDAYHKEYCEVLGHLAQIRLEKVRQYGIHRYEARGAEFNRWMCFSDVYRKWIRLEQQMLNQDVAGLIETYSDMANYCIMAVQILSRKPQGDKDVQD